MPYLENLQQTLKVGFAKLEQSLTKDAICRAANNVKLQAIYFMEGIE